MKPEPPLVIRPVTDPEELREVHASLLRPSFPPDELVSARWLIDGVESGTVSVLVAVDTSGSVATSVTERLGESQTTLLTYFATREDMRGRGVGSQLFARMLDEVGVRDSPVLVVAEVERPDRHAASPAHGDPTARLRFYGRHGALVLDLPYFQPAIGEGAAVPGMLLLALRVHPDHLTQGPDGSCVAGPPIVAAAIDAILGHQTLNESGAFTALRAASRQPLVRLYAVEDYQRITASN